MADRSLTMKLKFDGTEMLTIVIQHPSHQAAIDVWTQAYFHYIRDQTEFRYASSPNSAVTTLMQFTSTRSACYSHSDTKQQRLILDSGQDDGK